MNHTLRLHYQPPHDFRRVARVLREARDSGRRAGRCRFVSAGFLLIDGHVGSLQVRRIPGVDALQLEVDADKKLLPQVEVRVRRMFDLDADIATINAHLGARRHLKRSVARHPGQRLPGGWDGFEIAIRAVLGQQVTVAAARTLTERVVRKFGEVVRLPRGGEAQLFPSATDAGRCRSRWTRHHRRAHAHAAGDRARGERWPRRFRLPGSRSRNSSRNGRPYRASASGPRTISRCAGSVTSMRFRRRTSCCARRSRATVRRSRRRACGNGRALAALSRLRRAAPVALDDVTQTPSTWVLRA